MTEEFGLCEDFDVADDEGIFDILADIIDTSGDRIPMNSLGRDSGSVGPSNKGGKKRKVNPDAETIAAVTEEALRELDLDPDSQDAKKKRRQIRNRLSAQFHRDRKNAYIKTLEDTVEQKNAEIAQLQQTILALKTENEILKQASFVPRHSRTSSVGSTDVESIGSHSPGPADSPLLSNSSIESHIPNFAPLPPGPASIERNKIFTAPIFKSLAVLSVLCIICVTTLSNGPITSTTTGIVYSTSPIVQRRLEQRDDPIEVLTTYTTTDTTTAATLPASLLSAVNASLEKSHLRRSHHQPVIGNSNNSVLEMSKHTTNSNHKPLVASKDLIPLLLPSQHQQHDWFYHQQPFPSLSYSHIVMNNGLALFDPEMQFGQHDLDAMLSYSLIHKAPYKYTTTGSAASTASTSPSTSVGTAKSNSDMVENDHRVVPYEANALMKYQNNPLAATNNNQLPAAMNLNHNKELNMAEKHWPAIANPLHPTTTAPHKIDTIQSTSDCEIDKQALISKMLSASNLITVSLPASAVRLGKSFSDSRDGTMEGILQLFNLTNSNTNKEGTPAYPNSTDDATIELNCILLNAKLVVSGTAST